MSVNLDSLNGQIEDSVCNATWLAITLCGAVHDGKDKVPPWNGCHDGQEWTPEQLRIMANRVEQVASVVPTLRALAANGGVKIS